MAALRLALWIYPTLATTEETTFHLTREEEEEEEEEGEGGTREGRGGVVGVVVTVTMFPQQRSLQAPSKTQNKSHLSQPQMVMIQTVHPVAARCKTLVNGKPLVTVKDLVRAKTLVNVSLLRDSLCTAGDCLSLT